MKIILLVRSVFQKNYLQAVSIIVFVCMVQISFSQNNYDSLDEWFKTSNTEGLKKPLTGNLSDSFRIGLLQAILIIYGETNIDSAFKYGKTYYFLARKNNWVKEEAWSLDYLGAMNLRTGNAITALQLSFEALKKFETIKDTAYRTINYKNIGDAFNSQKDPRAFDYYFKAIKMAAHDQEGVFFKSWTMNALGSAYLSRNMPDSANYYAQQSYQLFQQILKIEFVNHKYYSDCLNLLGRIQQRSGNIQQALRFYRLAIAQAYATANPSSVSSNYMSVALLYKETAVTDSSVMYAMKAYIIATQLNNPYLVVETSSFLKEYYKAANKLDSAFKYQEILLSEKDKLFNLEKTRQVQNIAFNEQLRQQEIIAQQLQYRNRLITYSVLGIAILLLAVVFILWRNNRHKQQVNIILQEQKEEIQSTLTELKSTQTQLIQSEKMASLGELTAGIAHEIQNPLNFVNNFSEVNKELIEELKSHLTRVGTKVKTERDEQLEEELLNDLAQNSEKINHHGKRADAIVKGMLQHSRSSSGQKEPTNINALADEYLRLAYHGLRAKDKLFNATLKTDYDETIERVNIIPQDIGRVLLNLINNAFYAVTEKKKTQPQGYEPTVSMSTKRAGNKVEIKINDNGNGIPQSIVDKIFQPFFTTKPTGQGTGLGLSLSYDIIKAHGGELKVQTQEYEYSAFIICLPLNTN